MGERTDKQDCLTYPKPQARRNVQGLPLYLEPVNVQPWLWWVMGQFEF